MRLPRRRRLEIGRCGTFDFAPGWYLYVGSAFGPGGVKRRTDRHLRRLNFSDVAGKSKKPHWHTDHFREAATIEEIWFCHDIPEREHEWSITVHSRLRGEVPVPGFGSQDCEGPSPCPSHFFQFARRPVAASLRAELAAEHKPLYVEFPLPPRRSIIEAGCASQTLAASYHRGRRYLEERRLAAYNDPHSAAIHQDGNLICFRQGSVGRQIVARLTKAMDMDEGQLRADAEFADAVEKVIANCGPQALDVLLYGDRPQSRNDIMKISRKSRERQQHRINGVAEGRFRTVGPQSSDNAHAPDTKDFTKILSRLARARGSIEACRELLGWQPCSTSDRDKIIATISDCQVGIQKHLKVMSKLPARDGKKVIKKPAAKPSEHKLQIGMVPRQLASAMSLIKKNADNLATSTYDLRPTSDQRSKAQIEISRISEDCEVILRLLTVGKDSRR